MVRLLVKQWGKKVCVGKGLILKSPSGISTLRESSQPACAPDRIRKDDPDRSESSETAPAPMPLPEQRHI